MNLQVTDLQGFQVVDCFAMPLFDSGFQLWAVEFKEFRV